MIVTGRDLSNELSSGENGLPTKDEGNSSGLDDRPLNGVAIKLLPRSLSKGKGVGGRAVLIAAWMTGLLDCVGVFLGREMGASACHQDR